MSASQGSSSSSSSSDNEYDPKQSGGGGSQAPQGSQAQQGSQATQPTQATQGKLDRIWRLKNAEMRILGKRTIIKFKGWLQTLILCPNI